MTKTLKEIALMKKAFLESDFGKYAAEEITKLHGAHHQNAEDMKLSPYEKSAHCDRAAGIAEVISFFTADAALLDAGFFNKKEDEPQDS